MINLLTFLILGSVLMINYFRYRDLLYPPVLQSGLWLTITIAYVILEDDLVPLSGSMYLVIVSGVVLFGLGAFVSTLRFEPLRAKIQFNGVHYGLVAYLLLLVPLVGLPFYIIQLNELAHGGIAGNFFRDLRTSLNTQDDPLGIIAYLVPVSILSAGIHFLLFRRSYPFRSTISVLLAIVYCLLTTGRTSFLLLFALILGMLAITRQMRSRRALLLFAVSSILIFVTVALLRDLLSTMSSAAESARLTWESFRLYLLGSLPAFDRFMHTDATPALGTHLFRSLLAVGAKLGICNTPPSLVQDFADLPFDTNVYTVYQPYFADFSYPGIFIIQFVFGVVHGFLYRRADRGNPLYVLAFGFSLFPLTMQFFQDQYFNLLSTWVQYAAGLSLFFLFVPSRSRVPAK